MTSMVLTFTKDKSGWILFPEAVPVVSQDNDHSVEEAQTDW